MNDERLSRKHLARRYGPPALLVLLGLLAGLGFGLLRPPGYAAVAHVAVVAQRDDGTQTAQSFAQAYGRLAALPETLELSPSLPRPAARARKHVEVSTSPETPLIRITGTGSRPERAAAYADAAADALVRYGAVHAADTGVRVALMSWADRPLSPSTPNLPLAIAVGGASGLLLAVLLHAAAGRAPRTGRGVRRPACPDCGERAAGREAEPAGVGN